MNKILSFLCICTFVCCSNYGQLTKLTKLPKVLKENSGMAIGKDSTLWFINDSGNEDILYQVNFKGKLLKELKVKNAENRDWEDLSRDLEGNLYISDLGNNANKRKDLVIYKTSNPDNEKGEKIASEKIEISYPDQKDFPPKKKNLKFDSEAIFHAGNKIYVITKNRSKPFSGKTNIYAVPDEPGKYKATLINTLETCEEASFCQITAADISPDGKKIVFLSYGRLWVYSNIKLANFSYDHVNMIDLKLNTQLESVSFLDDKTLLISDEEDKKSGRNLYLFRL